MEERPCGSHMSRRQSGTDLARIVSVVRRVRSMGSHRIYVATARTNVVPTSPSILIKSKGEGIILPITLAESPSSTRGSTAPSSIKPPDSPCRSLSGMVLLVAAMFGSSGRNELAFQSHPGVQDVLRVRSFLCDSPLSVSEARTQMIMCIAITSVHYSDQIRGGHGSWESHSSTGGGQARGCRMGLGVTRTAWLLNGGVA